MKKAVFLQVAVLVLVITSSCTQTSELKEASPVSVKVSEDRLIRIDNMLQQSIDSGWIAGAIGFIARDGKIVYDKSFGINDIAWSNSRKDSSNRSPQNTWQPAPKCICAVS
ncbi:MAG: hypothetical protein NTV31_07240 [Bacteroidia bacterium]|nr:hypothetical protein [Bacteroidia bacterium]